MLSRKWLHTIDLSSFYHDESISIRRKGILVASALRLKILPWYEQDDDLKDLIEGFDDLPEEGQVVDGEPMSKAEIEEEFNGWMEGLYDWADRDRRLWIDTR